MDEWIEGVREPDGLIRREVALHAGVDPDQIMKSLRTGRLRRVQRGIYIRRVDELSPLARARAAVLSSSVGDAVASHHTAAQVHGIPLPDGTRPEHVTVARQHRRARRKELVFHGREMGLGDVVVQGTVPLTTVARTLVDLTPLLPETHAVWAVDDSLRRGLIQRDELVAVAQGRPGAPGDATARRLIEAADGLAESVLETAGRLAIQAAGLPLPIAQYRVITKDGAVYYLDGAYPREKVGLEFDGQGIHGAPEALYRDRQRQNALVLADWWNILRFTWWDVFHARPQFVGAVRSALENAPA